MRAKREGAVAGPMCGVGSTNSQASVFTGLTAN